MSKRTKLETLRVLKIVGVLGGGGLPEIEVTGTTALGSTPVGTAVPSTLTITNIGSGALNLTLPIGAPNGFEITSQPAVSSLSGGQSTTFDIAATAVETGSFSDNILIYNNSSDNPHSVAVSVTVTAVYLFQATFPVDDLTPPVGSPYTADVGSATIVDTGNKTTIQSGRFKVASITVAGSDPSFVDVVGQRLQINGRTLKAVMKAASLQIGFENASGAIPDTMAAAIFTSFHAYDFTSQVTLSAISTSTDYTIWIIQLYEGGLLLIQGGAFSSPTLLWKFAGLTQQNKFMSVVSPFAGASEIGDVTLRDFGGVWTMHNVLTTIDQDFPSASTGTSAADGFHEIIWKIATGEAGEIRFRRTDANNYMVARYTLATNTLALFSVTAGVESAAIYTNTLGGGSLANNDFARMTVRTDADKINISIRGTSASPARFSGIITSAVHQSATGYEIGVGMAYMRQFKFYPKTHTAPSTQSSKAALKVCVFGDSRATEEQSWPDVVGSLAFFGRAWEAEYTYGYMPRPAAIGHSGDTVALLKTRIDADLVTWAATGYVPDVMFIIGGANDALSSMSSENTFKTNYAYILDAIHNQSGWSNVKVGCSLPGVANQEADCDSLGQWIRDLIGTANGRSWAFEAADEQIVLGGGVNDYSVFTRDGTHPSYFPVGGTPPCGGYQVLGEAWEAAYSAYISS